ncbi:hypothetical protein GY631_1381 [Trichophyton interdigitale]|nr:hypothetical protein GY631_1381 [Trichophyton interdigitale]
MGRADVTGKGHVLFVVGTLMVTISGLFVFLRLVGRYLRDGIKADDWTILASLVLTIAFTVVINLGIGYGLGTHDHEIQKEDKMLAFKMLLSAQVLFKLIIGLAKVSILALYLRVFAASKYFRWACISLIIITSVLRDKLALIFVFVLGGFVCLISIIRSATFPQSAQPIDVTLNHFLFNAMWATVEMNTAIICACLPIIRQTLTVLFPQIFGRSSRPRSICFPRFFRRRSSRQPARRETNPSLSIAGSLPWTMHNRANVVTASVEPGRELDLTRTESEERIIDMETLEACCGGILKQTDVYISETRMDI